MTQVLESKHIVLDRAERRTDRWGDQREVLRDECCVGHGDRQVYPLDDVEGPVLEHESIADEDMLCVNNNEPVGVET